MRDIYNIIDITSDILNKALSGPTTDLVENIQLHIAANRNCDYFLTSDEKILKMKFFGKTQLVNHIPQ